MRDTDVVEVTVRITVPASALAEDYPDAEYNELEGWGDLPPWHDAHRAGNPAPVEYNVDRYAIRCDVDET